ncbi:hypothetical protein [Collinsella sp. An2]|uniref:hypothetical protein n=1 Tax=Collinsella sp. An2 TaxID=1965585 RepID=UPI000B3A331D|nr:hypothetical protein [Collinsella sp. An2]OUP09176.1 hypothetical protein B5F33_05440 [Collinsella sp. An2]
MNRHTASHIGALVAHDLYDALRNPTMLMMLAACMAIAAFFGFIAQAGTRFDAGEAPAFLMASMLACAPSFAGCTLSLYVMSEERERGAYVTLVEAGVSMGCIAASKLVSALVATCAVELAMVVAMGPGQVDPTVLAAFLALSVVASLPVLLLGVSAGLVASEQMASSALSVVVMAVAVSPLLSFMSEHIYAFTWFLPMGPAVGLIRHACDIAAIGSPALLGGLAFAWTVGFAVLTVACCRRAARVVEAEVMRR